MFWFRWEGSDGVLGEISRPAEEQLDRHKPAGPRMLRLFEINMNIRSASKRDALSLSFNMNNAKMGMFRSCPLTPVPRLRPQMSERLLDVENEAMLKIVELEKQLMQTNKELDHIRVRNQAKEGKSWVPPRLTCSLLCAGGVR